MFFQKLRKEGIGMTKQPVGIVGAMEVEIEAVLEAAADVTVQEHTSMKFYEGLLSGVPFVAAQCAPGKVNSALCAQVMADFYHPRMILNIGVAGGIGRDVKIGDVVIATSCVEYDFDGSGLSGCPVGQMDLPTGEEIVHFPCDEEISGKLAAAAESLYGHAHRGVIATGDKFVADPAFGRSLNENFSALACEMEGASTAHTCYLNQIPCAVLRTISDNGNDDAPADFPTFAKESAYKAQRLLAGVIESL